MSDGDEDLVQLMVVHDEVEAQAITDLLDDGGIPHSVTPYGVSQYPGVRTGSGAWGEVRVPRDHEQAARSLVDEFECSRVGDYELEQQALGAAPVPPARRKRDDRAVALVVSLLLSALFLWLIWMDW
jgi:hypothetical protein